MKAFSLILRQTVSLAFRKGGGALGTMAFYIITVTLFIFGLGPENMHQHAGAVMCVALLLATVTALPLFYERDHEDGTLEQYLLQPVMLEILVLAKICGQWLACIVPMLLVSPLLAVMANLDAEQTVFVLKKLALASPTVVALGSIAAALTLGSRRGGLLQSLIVMPLYIPVLIFAASPGEHGALLFLSGMLFAALPIACFASAALIRISQD
jgi:heme exporter protein B